MYNFKIIGYFNRFHIISPIEFFMYKSIIIYN
nr:MAG TPA: hypothetical protein [Caudoviricetes sp.]